MAKQASPAASQADNKAAKQTTKGGQKITRGKTATRAEVRKITPARQGHPK